MGPKLAARIAAELKDKVAGISISPEVAQFHAQAITTAPRTTESEAIAALVKLGYTQSAAVDAVARAAQAIGPNADAMPLDVLLRESLRLSARL